MKLAIAAVAGIAVGVTAAYAENKKPQKMTDAQMDRVYAGFDGDVIGIRVGPAKGFTVAVPVAAEQARHQVGAGKLPAADLRPGRVDKQSF